MYIIYLGFCIIYLGLVYLDFTIKWVFLVLDLDKYFFLKTRHQWRDIGMPFKSRLFLIHYGYVVLNYCYTPILQQTIPGGI